MADKAERIATAVDGLAEEMLAFARRLVQVPSETGAEGEAQALVARTMRDLGLEVDLWEPDPAELLPYADAVGEHASFAGRPNVVGILRGTGRGKSLLLNGHVDVVPAGDPASWSHPPFAGEVVDGVLFGRGACDMKGGLAAMLFAVVALREAGLPPRGDLRVASVVGEELGGAGTVASLLRGHRADAAIVAEPTRLSVMPAVAGSAMFRLHIAGRSAHACVRDEGVSAVEKMCLLFPALAAFEGARNARLRHPLYARIANKVPVSVGTVQAGEWASSVPDKLTAEGRAGLLPGESLATLQAEFEAHIMAWAKRDPWLKAHPPRVEWFPGQYAPAEIAADSPLARLVSDCFAGVTGREATLEGATYGSDMRHLIELAGIPTLMFGPGNVRVAHFSDEHVAVADLATAAKVFALVASEWGGA